MYTHGSNLAAAAPPALPADPAKAIADVAKLLGVADPTDVAAIVAAIEACAASPAAVDLAARRAGLSAREAAMLSTMRGATVALVGRYVANKRATTSKR